MAAFAEFGKRVVLFCHVTTRVKGDKYDGLLREKGGTGFPTLVFMDAAGEVIAKQGARTVSAFQATLTSLTNLRALEARAKDGDQTVKVDMALTRIELGALATVDAAKQALAAAGDLSPEQQKRASGLLAWLEMNELNANARKDRQLDVGKELVAWFSAGKIPGRDERGFFLPILNHAEKQHDAKLFQKALDEYRARVGHDESAKALLEVQDVRCGRLFKYEQLTAKANAGDAQAAFELVLLRLEMSEIRSLAEAKQLVAAASVSAEQKQRADGWLLGLEVQEMIGEAVRGPAEGRNERQRELQSRLAEMFGTGRVPSGNAQGFFSNLVRHAERTKDQALLAKVAATLKERSAAEPQLRPLVKVAETALGKLRSSTAEAAAKGQ